MRIFIFKTVTAILLFLCVACNKRSSKHRDIISKEMAGFMRMLDGNSASVMAALDQFGAPGLDKDFMYLWNLEKPEVLEAEGNCYLLRCKSGMTKRKYRLCWQNGKIISVADKGMEYRGMGK